MMPSSESSARPCGERGLTLRELRTIEKTMIESLTAIYHGRLK
jgi:membrane-associated HD superfamily phosphohydrolase